MVNPFLVPSGSADFPIFINVASGFDTGNGAASSVLGSGDGVEQTLVLAVASHTRLGAAVPTGVIVTTGGYALGSSGFDAIGDPAGRGLLGSIWGTRSQSELRQDWLNFYGGDQYVFRSNFAGTDGSQSVAFYRLPYPWKVVQVASGSTASIGLSATFASPVGANSRVVIGVATLDGVTVVSPPANAFFDGTIGEATGRTSRITAYRIKTAMAGQTTRSVTLSANGGAMTMIEVAETDSLLTNLSTAIRAIPSYLGLWPMQHTLSTIERNWGGSLGGNLTSFGNFTGNYAEPGTDGRSYATHAVGSIPSTLVDANAWTPHANGGLTIGFLVKFSSLATAQTVIAKYSSASGNREWAINISTAGVVSATAYALAGTAARSVATAAGAVTAGVWYFIICRFGSTTTSFPSDIRINGVSSGTQSGAGTINGNQSTNVAVGGLIASSTTNALGGAMGQLFAAPGVLSNGDCAVLEAAAQADGWF